MRFRTFHVCVSAAICVALIFLLSIILLYYPLVMSNTWYELKEEAISELEQRLGEG